MTYGPAGVKSWLKHSRYQRDDFWETQRTPYILNNSTVSGYWKSIRGDLITVLTLAKSGHSALRTTLPTLKQAIQDMVINGTLLCHADNMYYCFASSYPCDVLHFCYNFGGVCGEHGQCVCY